MNSIIWQSINLRARLGLFFASLGDGNGTSGSGRTSGDEAENGNEESNHDEQQAENNSNDLNNLDKEFNDKLEEIEKIFRPLSSSFFSVNSTYGFKIFLFGFIQWKGATPELFDLKRNSNFAEGGIFNEEYYTGEQLGNFAYGYAAREAGVDLITALFGAGLYGIINNSEKDWYNIIGFFDKWGDSEMIIRGYFYERKK